MGQRFAPPTDAEITVGSDTTGVFPVVVQLKGQSGEDMLYSGVVLCYLSSDSDGDVLAIDGTDTSEMAQGTDGTLICEHTTDVVQTIKSEADGDIDLNITVITAHSAYLVVVLPNGRVIISDEMAYTA